MMKIVNNRIVAVLLCIVAIFLFAACKDKHEAEDDDGGKDVVVPDDCYADSRTILVYVVAENSLSGGAVSDLNEILLGVKNSNLYMGDKVVVYLDDTRLPRVYCIDKTVTAQTYTELVPEVEYEEDVNSASKEQFEAILQYVKERYPASSYGVVMWSHASGWLPSTAEMQTSSTKSRRKSFGVDNEKNTTSNIGSQMSISDIARTLEAFGGTDFIFFDACFMQTVEVAYELRNATKYIIASPAEIPGPGADYRTMIPACFQKNDWADAMLSAYYDSYSDMSSGYGLVISSVDTKAMSNYAAYVKSVVSNEYEAILSANYDNVLRYFQFVAWSRDYPDFYDARGVMKNVLERDTYAQWLEEEAKFVTCKHTSAWYSAFNRKQNYIDASQCSGISMYVPLSKYVYGTGACSFAEFFPSTSWAKYVWNESEESEYK
ncbi:MAG: hypothetical protein J1F40_03435 [Prevotellaceae bacterium]|nr:hypothetical protein [Prevotellaceae bacterium]